ncbi:hypothetical protein JCM5350_007554 [Sporobolomyces pararoseus]
MGKPNKKQLKRQERRAEKAAEQRELATRNADEGSTGGQESGAKDASSTVVDGQSSSKAKGKAAGREEKNGLKEPRWSTGLMSEVVTCQPGGVARAYKHLGIDPKVGDQDLLATLSTVLTEAIRSHPQGINVKSRFGSALLIACSRSRDDDNDPFHGLVDMLYLLEANKYLSTLSLPLPNSESVKNPYIRVKLLNPRACRAASTDGDAQWDSSHRSDTPQEDLSEKNKALEEEIDKLRTEKSKLLERIETERKRSGPDSANDDNKLFQLEKENSDLKKEVAKLKGESLTPSSIVATTQALQECNNNIRRENEKVLKREEEEKKANKRIEESRQARKEDQRDKERLCDRVKELEEQKERDAKLLEIANEKLKAAQAYRSARGATPPPPPPASPSKTATPRKQTSEKSETQEKASNKTEINEVKNLLAVQNRVTKELAEEVSKLRASQIVTPASLTDKKDYVIESLSKKVIDLSRQVKDQNDQFGELSSLPPTITTD